jgi:uncharacterized protein YecE (DUF72 family)
MIVKQGSLSGVADGVTDAVAAVVPPDWIAPILSTGVVGIILLMILFRYKIQPTYVLDDAKREWERERAAIEARHAEERRHDQEDVVELKRSLREGTEVYTQQVIPLLTRLLDSERELVELRREEARRRNRGDE